MFPLILKYPVQSKRFHPRVRSRKTARMLAFAGVLAISLTVVAPQPARAGVISDALVAISSWVANVEQAISEWFDSTIGGIEIVDRDESAARAIADMAVDDPASLTDVSTRAGFRLTSVVFARDGRRVHGLTFAYDRAVSSEERLALWRDVLEVEDTPFRPEMELVRLLLNASDVQENRPPQGLSLETVEIRIEDELDARWHFTPAAPQ